MLLLACAPAWGADWPTYQHDNARSGVTAEQVAPPLSVQWVFRSPHPPARGWPEPERGEVWSYGIERVHKVRYDDSFPAAAAGDAVYFASSAANKVYSLEAATGRLRWATYTDAPPRLAPTVRQGRVYVGADDGFVYCLGAADGRIVWKFRAAPHADRALGHGKVMSLWPVRTGVLVDSGRAYFGAGLFPAEGLYLYAVDAENGGLLWRNDTYDQAGRGEISPQGYLLASRGRLIVPSGRVAPAVFDRADGRLLFAIQGGRALSGGTCAALAGERLYNGTQLLVAYDLVRTKKDRYGRDIRGPAIFSLYKARRIILDKGTGPPAAVKRGGDPTAYVVTDAEMLAVPQAALPEAAGQVDAVRKLNWDKRNQVKAYGRLRSDLAGLDPKSPRRARLIQEIAKLKPHCDAVAAAERKLSAYLDRTCRWRLACRTPDSLILAGGTLFAGGQGCVIAVDAASGRKIWAGKVDGTARALAAANGRLLVSTTAGSIYCFASRSAAGGGAAKEVALPREAQPQPNDDLGRLCEATAGRILRETPIRRGYCLILGGGTGRLAYELAKRTELSIYAVEPDAEKVARARQALSRARLYGARVCVERADLRSLPHPAYFANLVICAEALLGGEITTPAKELLRVLRPLGGVAYVGQPPEARGLGRPLEPQRLRAWLRGLDGANVETSVRGAWARITRGALKGCGWWSHQHATPGNTACSGDRLVGGPLGVLWFGDPGPRKMIDRHARGPAPLSTSGRLFIVGDDVVMAYDAYNGLRLWDRRIPGAKREHVGMDCGNAAATDESLFVAAGDKCLRLDAATGRTRQTYAAPPRKDGRPRRWGWIAVSGRLLFGSRTESAEPFRSWPEASGNTSECLFALDAAAGSARWIHDAEGILHPSIAVGGGSVFFVGRAVTEQQRAQAIRERIKDADATEPPRLDRKGKPIDRDVRLVVALDAATGARRWARALDVTDCVVGPAVRKRAGGQICLLHQDNVLVVCSAPWDGHFMDEWNAGRFAGRRIIALAADTGRLLWSGRKGYRSRPIIAGDAIFAEPWAHDLRTGQTRMHRHPITARKEKWAMWRGFGGCGMVAASARTLFFRAGCIAYYDLAADEGVVSFGAQRPGCWINFIPAGGLVLIPEASAHCDCALAIQCSVALYPRAQPRAWAEYPLPKPLTPVRHIAVNLGAPGDRRDKQGRLWIHCPNRVHKWHWLGGSFLEHPRAGYYCREPDVLEIEGTDKPPVDPGAPGGVERWVFASGARGLKSFTVPLLAKGSGRAAYTVRLSFAEPEDLRAGERVFSVALQGRTVLRDFDVAREAGGPRRALVKEFRGVEAADVLTVELTPSAQAKRKLPILCGLEAACERVLPR